MIVATGSVFTRRRHNRAPEHPNTGGPETGAPRPEARGPETGVPVPRGPRAGDPGTGDPRPETRSRRPETPRPETPRPEARGWRTVAEGPEAGRTGGPEGRGGPTQRARDASPPSVQVPREKPTSRPADQPSNRATEQPSNRATEQPSNRARHHTTRPSKQHLAAKRHTSSPPRASLRTANRGRVSVLEALTRWRQLVKVAPP
jgi:hypothetical protein